MYQYRYNVNVTTNLGETRSRPNEIDNESTLHIDATVSLQFSTDCEGYLKISDASVSQDRSHYVAEYPDRAGAEFKESLEKHILRFAFDDGQMRELCPDPGETTWALNLKRGVLSYFQNNMKRFDVDRRVDELDVNGVCETQYKLHEAKKTSLIVKKTKDLGDCTYGGRHLSVVQSVSYRSPLSRSKNARKSLLKSRSECEITIDHNIYEQVICRDFHLLKPLSNGDKAGARTQITSMIKLLRETDEINLLYDDDSDDSISKSLINTKRTTLLYDHAKTAKTMHGELRTSRDFLKTLCKLGDTEELQHRFAETFTGFINSARLLDYPSLSQLFARGNSICKTGKYVHFLSLSFFYVF